MQRLGLFLLVSSFSLCACSPGSTGAADGGSNDDPPDAHSVSDAGSPVDGGPNWPLAGFGALAGDCDVLDVELSDGSPHYFSGSIDFGSDPFDAPTDISQLTAGGQEILAAGNLGGSSEASEVFAYEVLARCEGAALLKSEGEILYTDPAGKKSDLLVDIDGVRVGVSVTRAVTYPRGDSYPVESAVDLLTRKLNGVLTSSANVHPDDRWQKQILSVLAYGPEYAVSLRDAWDQIDAETKADTILYVTVTEGDDGFIY